MKTPLLLKLGGIRKAFGGVAALRGVSFELMAGEIHALVGENGAGKSTFIKVITGAHAPDGGTFELGGKSVGHFDPRMARALGIAAIYEQPALFPDLTVAENLALRLERTTAWRLISWRKRERDAVALLARVGAESIPTDAPVRELTMPQQQLVEIAAAVGSDSRVLILDEPTASLGERDAANLFRVLRELRGQGAGMIYISHRLEELAKIADRVTVFRDGAYVGTYAMADVDPAKLIRLMVGREVSSVFPKIEAKLGDVVLETRGLRCAAGGVGGINPQGVGENIPQGGGHPQGMGESSPQGGINLHVRAGEVLGLGGLTGAGR